MNDLLTTRQLMELLHVDRTTIYRMLNDGRLPGVRVGGQWRFSRQAIDAMLADPKGVAASEPKPAQKPAGTPVSTKVLPLYCLQPIQQVFALTSETGAITTDLHGKPLTPVSNSCAFCSLIQSTEKGRAQCQASWQRLADMRDESPRLETCHAGLTYTRGRIVVGGAFIAMFFVGQFIVESVKGFQVPSHIGRVAHLCGVEEQALARAAKEIRVVPAEHAERLLGLVQMMADTYSHIGQERLELLSRLKQVAEIAGGAG